ncbi:MAG: alpha-glucan family phosphorylase [Parachlamydiaceae bacterium]|nr:alpha-glucan family phosphorylase [Parachlamydiaceae bacterium]
MLNQRDFKGEGFKDYETLEEIAYDLIWSWDHKADIIWKELDPELWALTRNPLVILETVSKEKLKKVLIDPKFCKIIQELKLVDTELDATTETWFHKKNPQKALTAVAYFSMEFMLSEALPIYSGGLGNVAGDQLKAVNDLGVPVVAVGLLYQQGYFRQIIDKNGAQQALYPYNSPEQLPIKPVRLPNGEWLRIEIALPGWKLWLRAWEVKVGRVKLYLLDSNDAANYPPHRAITSELYGGDAELRLKQEIVLGIGGWRLLEAIGIKPEVCHLNEGHAAFAILERAKSYMKATSCSFEIALTATRAGNLFTTHTAVPAGFDRFNPSFIKDYLGLYAKEHLGISVDELLSLGRENSNNSEEPFNMAYLAMRGSGAINAVSLLHEKVSRHIFAPLFPRWPINEIPVGHVTNGIHVRSWDSAMSDNLWTEACGKNRWLGEIGDLEKEIRAVPDVKIWQMRETSRKAMIDYIRDTLSRLLEARGAPTQDVEQAKHQFNPNVFTMGFARRFATYKRPNMLLHDPERLIRILTNKERPVQLVLAGKAHPADKEGQDLIQQWMQFIWRPDVRASVAFISDYDMLVTEQLVAGVDLWINTPRRPWEACGTSGMKILVNGGLNLSELDGWWAEAYKPEIGWAIGDGQEHGEDPAWDANEANKLYDLLENEIIPEFYNRNKEGIPTAWLSKVRESMAQLTPQFSTNRSVSDYTEKYYLPAAENYRKRVADEGRLSKEIVKWKHAMEEDMSKLRFEGMKAETQGDRHHFEIQINFNGLDPNVVKVELFANGSNESFPMIQEKVNNYYADIAAVRPITDFTIRVIPYFPGVAVPLENNQILWQR